MNPTLYNMNNKLVFYGTKNYKRHNNCRYAALMPRLKMVVPKYYILNRFRVIAYLHEYLYHKVIEPLYIPWLAKKYPGLLCTDVSQIRLFPGPIVVDVDDPDFDSDLIDRLNNDRVVAVITTTKQLRIKLISEGLQPPCYVIPSGVDKQHNYQDTAQQLRSLHPRESKEVRLGYAVPKLYMAEELTGSRHSPESMLRSIDWLLEMMQKVWLQNSEIELWLIGETSNMVKRVCKNEKRIHLLGYIQYENILPYYSLFDIALYPRVTDVQGRHSIKLLEYMACGLPIVSTAVSEAFHVRDSGAGIICPDQDKFIQAVVHLAERDELRQKLGDRGREYATAFDWNEIAYSYDKILIDCVESDQFGSFDLNK
jgi:glycosyltransferase involved in cell wall biosynthesis